MKKGKKGKGAIRPECVAILAKADKHNGKMEPCHQ